MYAGGCDAKVGIDERRSWPQSWGKNGHCVGARLVTRLNGEKGK